MSNDLSMSQWHINSCLDHLADTVIELTQTDETIVYEDNGIDNDMICIEYNWDGIGEEIAEDVKVDGDW